SNTQQSDKKDEPSKNKSHLGFTPLKNNKALNTNNETPDINDILDDQSTHPSKLSKKKRNKDSSTSEIKDYNKKNDFSNSHFPAASSNNTVAHTSAKQTNKQIDLERIVKDIKANLDKRRGFFDLSPDDKMKKIQDAYDQLKKDEKGMQLLNKGNFKEIKKADNKAIKDFLDALKDSRSLFHLGKVQSYQEFKSIIESMNGLEKIVNQITTRLADKRASFFNNSAAVKAANISTAFYKLNESHVSELYEALKDITKIPENTSQQVKNFINALNESRSLLNLGDVKSFQEFKFKMNALKTYVKDADESNELTPTKK
ncbi:MAG: hypothetical protein HYX60_03785, partial [Legionella longbeachae]|nr:hypothetical protein [Legionella longbeachae]